MKSFINFSSEKFNTFHLQLIISVFLKIKLKVIQGRKYTENIFEQMQWEKLDVCGSSVSLDVFVSKLIKQKQTNFALEISE